MRQPASLPVASHPPHGPAAHGLAERIAASLPPTLVRLWRESGRGTLVVSSSAPPHYAPGPFFWRHVRGWGALHLPPQPTTEALWQVVGHWLDHFAGSFGKEARLSDGAGATPRLGEAAHRYAEIVALGYAAPALGTDQPGELLARAIAEWHCGQRHLSSADPLLARWLRGALFDEGLWRAVAPEVEGEG